MQAIEQVIAGLNYDFDHFEIHDFIRHVAGLRGRDILLQPVDLKPELTGVWVPGETADYIFVNRKLHPIHQVHCILHEMAHIILEHRCHKLSDVLPEPVSGKLRLRGAVGRPRSAATLRDPDDEEKAAEAFVHGIQKHVVIANRLAELIGPGTSIAGFNPFADAIALMD